MDNIGGAEIVVLTLARELNADIYTTNISKNKIIAMGFSDVISKIKSIGKVPINAPFKQQMAFYKFRKLKLKGYDFFIIAGDWAMSAAVNNKPNLWYVHSPMNELWALRRYLRKDVLEWWKRIPYDVFVLLNRRLSIAYSKHVQTWVCNSENTRKRVMKYYGYGAIVINPPVDCSKFKFMNNKGYWLSVNRLITHKRIEMQLRAFAKLSDETLIIVGSYEKDARHFEKYKKFVERIKPKNARIINWVSDKDLKKLYSESKGLICTAKGEDFGMTPVEAMASGKPVIAVNEGGYKGTVVDGKTGKLIKADVDSLVEAIKEVGKNVGKYKTNCFERAKKFDVNVFIEKIKEEIKK